MCIRPAQRRRQRETVPLVTHGTFCLLYSFYLIKKQLKVDTYLMYNMYIRTQTPGGRRVETVGIFFFFNPARRAWQNNRIIYIHVCILLLLFLLQ